MVAALVVVPMQPYGRLSGVEGVTTDVRDREVRDFESWLVAREPALRRLAVLLAPDPHTAADLVQATLAKMYLAWPRLADRDGGNGADAYARTILLNEHRSWWRRAFRRREVVSEAVPDVAAPTHPSYDGGDDEVWSWVVSLPPRQRAVIVLRYYEQLTEAEIADTLGISVGTVKSQASRALAALRTRVPQEEPS